MKKLLLSIITLIYFMMSSGIAMEVHYCMGKKTGFDLYKISAGKCSKCGMKEKKGGCCRDEHTFYKLSDDHKNVSGETGLKVPAVVIAEPFFFDRPYYLSARVIPAPKAHAPPDLPQDNISIFCCIFRI